MIENASLLAGAVIKRAILDYKCRLRCYKTLDEYRESSSLELKELEAFFRSSWCDILLRTLRLRKRRGHHAAMQKGSHEEMAQERKCQVIKIENVVVSGWEAAIRGMRNPMNSWSQSDSHVCNEYTIREEMPCKDCNDGKYGYCVGKNDWVLMRKLSAAGSVHGKYLRFITVTADIVAPLYWWKEYDTYKVGTVANSCSTMHKIADKEFTLDDFSHEHLDTYAMKLLRETVDTLNRYRELYVNYDSESFEIKGCPSKKMVWWQMIQLLPSSYNQRRTVLLNYEVLCNMYHSRKCHRLDEWCDFCRWIETLPYSEVITGERDAQAPEADGART